MLGGKREIIAFPLCEQPLGGAGERGGLDRRAQRPHQLLVVVQVVQRVQARAEDLVRFLQVVEIGAREMAAGVAGALRVERARVVAMARIADLEIAVAGEEPAVTRVARRQHAVEEVDARRDRLDQIFRRAHAHQVARPLFGQPRAGENAPAVLLRFADREAADGVAVEADVDQALDRRRAQLRMDAALDDAEQRVRAIPCAFRPCGPAHRQFHRLPRFRLGRRIRRAFVEHHGDVGSEHLLDAHRLLGREEQAIAVERRGELHAFLGDLAQRAEAEDLEAARVGEDRPVPAHEAVQAAVPCDDFEPRAQPQMKSVAEHDLRPSGTQFLGRHGLHRAIGADGHERRGVDASMRELEHAAARAVSAMRDAELHRSISMASP